MSTKLKASGGKGLLREIAASSLETLEAGSYDLDGSVHDLKSRIERTITRTAFHPAHSNLSNWSSVPQQEHRMSRELEIIVSECSSPDRNARAEGKVGLDGGARREASRGAQLCISEKPWWRIYDRRSSPSVYINHTICSYAS